jgi:hypothetical protein
MCHQTTLDQTENGYEYADGEGIGDGEGDFDFWSNWMENIDARDNGDSFSRREKESAEGEKRGGTRKSMR